MKSLPTAPQASRRALLMGFAAAATPMAPALANALSEPAPAVADPIFAVIGVHQAILDELWAIDDFVWNAPDDTDFPEDMDERTTDANHRRMVAELVLLTTEPTSVAGVIAALEYLASENPNVVDDDTPETILQHAAGWTAPELQIAVQGFLARMAAALRNIVERGQA